MTKLPSFNLNRVFRFRLETGKLSNVGKPIRYGIYGNLALVLTEFWVPKLRKTNIQSTTLTKPGVKAPLEYWNKAKYLGAARNCKAG